MAAILSMSRWVNKDMRVQNRAQMWTWAYIDKADHWLITNRRIVREHSYYLERV